MLHPTAAVFATTSGMRTLPQDKLVLSDDSSSDSSGSDGDSGDSEDESDDDSDNESHSTSTSKTLSDTDGFDNVLRVWSMAEVGPVVDSANDPRPP